MELSHLIEGTVYTKEDIEKIFGTNFGYNITKGIHPLKLSDGTPILLLFSRADGPYTDRIEQDIFFYDGEGRDRDQQLTGGNKVIAEANQTNRSIFGFRQHAVGQWRYLGLLAVENFELVNKGGFKTYEFELRLTHVARPTDLISERTRLEQQTLNAPQLTDARPRQEQRITRAIRSEAFQRHVKEEYDFTCAICRKRRFSKSQAPEVDSAHIYPKERDGPDDLRNGIALCKLHHWAFDNGLLALDDEMNILVATHILNDQNYDWITIFHGQKALQPLRSQHNPHPLYLQAHRAIHGF